MNLHISYSVTDDCENLYDSYGTICVWCNCCGRIDKDTKYEAQLRHYEKMLQEQYTFNRWHEDKDIRENQEDNIKSNIKYFKEVIEDLKKLVSK